MIPRRILPTTLLCAGVVFLTCHLSSAQSNKLTATIDGVTFDSDYDNGSLGSVSFVAPGEFDATLFTEVGEKGTRKYWFRFTMSGVAGRSLQINLEHTRNPVPFIRVLDPGPGDWRRMTPGEAPDSDTMLLSFDTNTTTVELAFFEPLGYAETMTAVSNLVTASPHASMSTLGQSFENRDLHLIVIDDPAFPSASKYRVWLHARVHAGEITSAWSMLGFLDQILESSDAGQRLRENIIFHIVPQVNVDELNGGTHDGMPRESTSNPSGATSAFRKPPC